MAVMGVQTGRRFAGSQDRLTYRHEICYYGDTLRIRSFFILCHGICRSREDDFSLSFRKIDCQLLLQRVWAEMDNRLDVCHVTKGGHLEHLRGMQKNTWGVSLSICKPHVTILSSIQVH